MQSHGTHPHDHLRRAKALLKRPGTATLLYAALELRCAIEGRLKQYAQAHDHLSKREIADYRIKNLHKAVTKISDLEHIIAIVAQIEPGKPLEFVYTPVSQELRDRGGKLGDLLHYRKDTDAAWHERTHAFVAETARQCEAALVGTMLVPPTFTRNEVSLLVETTIDPGVQKIGRSRRDLLKLCQTGFPMLVYKTLADYHAKRPTPIDKFVVTTVEVPPPRVEIEQT
jgi:hypothetical protein